jgi:hypothetical protein
MTDLTLTVDLSKLNPTQLAALQSVVVVGMTIGDEQSSVYHAIATVGREKCGRRYFPELERMFDLLQNGLGSKA